MTVQNWREIQKQNITNIDFLCDFLKLDFKKKVTFLKNPYFPLNLPIRLAKKIKKNTLHDPILKQFAPVIDEIQKTSGFSLDPVKDATFCKSTKLIQKYHGRALLVTTGACAMHCRYCFRKNFSYETTRRGFEHEMALIKQDSSLKEIILSGGDPLSLNNKNLKALLLSLDNIAHLKRIRFHTRFPIGIPERIDEEFLSILSHLTKQIYFVIHANHPLELDEYVLSRIKQIQCLGIPTLCQTVLLREVNDNVTDLKILCELLADHGIIPYYLHQLDKVQGSSHFEVEQDRACKIIGELRNKLSGYAVFRYVAEIPNKASKTILA